MKWETTTSVALRLRVTPWTLLAACREVGVPTRRGERRTIYVDVGCGTLWGVAKRNIEIRRDRYEAEQRRRSRDARADQV